MQRDTLNPFGQHAAKAVGLLKALGSEPRLLVLCYLAEAGELSAGELTAQVGLSQSALSQHLAKLREQGFLATRKEAQAVFYRVCDPNAERLLALLHELFCPELGQPAGTGIAPHTKED
ncbi:MAG: metalloregulator ArsR/SmtB family transcription factor [Gammaproteobacteria bacterium]|nr:metalloregulator ArsR/SmtB family transcription factor [Gammaproteobacteria bacterium]MBU2409386.1 metalloregulator ArsR/SmtB family transcription factor [Gammaproteobacteria bacterium]